MAIVSLNPCRRVYRSAQRTTPLNQRVNHKPRISSQSLMGSFTEAENLSIRLFALSLRQMAQFRLTIPLCHLSNGRGQNRHPQQKKALTASAPFALQATC